VIDWTSARPRRRRDVTHDGNAPALRCPPPRRCSLPVLQKGEEMLDRRPTNRALRAPPRRQNGGEGEK